MQKRARNLAAEELSIEVISGRGVMIFGDTGLNIPFADVINIKSTLEVMMFGRGSAFHALPQIGGIVQRSMKEDYSIIYSFVLDLLVPIIENRKKYWR